MSIIPITTIGFVTKNRVAVLERALESYIQNTKTYGRSTEFVVMDDSEDVGVRSAYKQMLQTLLDGNLWRSLGFDNRELLPPFMPVCRGEDGTFGSLFMTCLMDDYIAYVPWAIFHDPQPPRENKPEDIRIGGSRIQFHNILRSCMLGYKLPEGDKPDIERLKAVGQDLIDFGNQSQTEFEDFVCSQLAKSNENTIESLRKRLRLYHGSPKYWALDIKAYMKNMQEVGRRTNYLVPEDLRSGRTDAEARALAQHLVVRFGYLLTLWFEMVDAAKRLRSQGVRLAQAV